VKVGFLLVAIMAVAIGIAPVYGTVESVQLLPPVLVVGQPIIFFGTVSGSTQGSRLGVHVYAGNGCPATTPIASTYTLANNGTYTIANTTLGIYNVTLTFPVTPSSGWVVVEQRYQDEMPAGNYSVGVEEVASGGSGVCKNFTAVIQPVPEFLQTSTTLFLALLAPLYLLRHRRQSNILKPRRLMV